MKKQIKKEVPEMKPKKKEKHQELYMVGSLNEDYEEGFEIFGIFSTYEKALDNCADDSYFIGIVHLDMLHKENLIKEMDAHFPLKIDENSEEEKE